MRQKKKVVDVTDKIAQAGVVTGRLREFEMMMKTNREAHIWEGRECNDKGAVEANKISKERNIGSEKANRRY